MRHSKRAGVSGRRAATLRLRLVGLAWLLGAVIGTSTSGLAASENPHLADRDLELEQALLKGRVVEQRTIGTGVTLPTKLVLLHRGERYEAAFKTVDIQKPGLTDFNDGKLPVLNFTDSYRFERAAYLLDRELGLHMVPVAVLRRLKRYRGAVIEWVGDAVDETARREEGLEPPDPDLLERQKAEMRLFDALILNSDRNAGNRLVTPADWKLHLIDHSRAFRPEDELPDVFVNRAIRVRRDVYERLKALDRNATVRLLKPYVSRVRVDALFVRRDAIVAAIESKRRALGDTSVFFD